MRERARIRYKSRVERGGQQASSRDRSQKMKNDPAAEQADGRGRTYSVYKHGYECCAGCTYIYIYIYICPIQSVDMEIKWPADWTHPDECIHVVFYDRARLFLYEPASPSRLTAPPRRRVSYDFISFFFFFFFFFFPSF